jgi:N-acetylglucosamine-6-phosphate deacetylase
MPERGVRLVTLAPELPGALETIRALVANRVVVSAGHSMATYDEAMAGFAAGIRYGTHLFNAMPAFNHRDPGLPGALLTDPRVVVGFIADGVHTHPSVIGLVWRALGGRRLSLVSDAMAALGMPSGQHRLGDFDVWVDATSARLADGTLAGSILALDQALRNLRNVPVRGMAGAGCTLTEALPTVTTTPADLLDLGDSPPRLRRSGRGAKPPCGTASRLAPGHQADLTLLTSDLQVQATIVAGRVVYTR